MLVGVQNEILWLHTKGLLSKLLVDKTTKGTIIWGTDAYKDMGEGYQKDQEMQAELMTGVCSSVIKTRARKDMEQQQVRTKKHAEVFSPMWLCKKMVSDADALWFGGKDAFLEEGDVVFPKDKTWQNYVDEKRMEITCGEAPFLVQRYDATTGEGIVLSERHGLLDRKLRVVGENCHSEEEWKKWALRAFQATYGYDYQGDNLLIARVNLLMTYEEYLEERWRRKPTMNEYRSMANVIVWNLWQMDGLTGNIPFCPANDHEQISLFDLFADPAPATPKKETACRIYDWRKGKSIDYASISKGERGMKFDFIIGNPPYQEETTECKSEKNGQKPSKNIFHLFQMDVDKIVSNTSVLIYPGARWMHRSGKGMAKFGLEQINATSLQRIDFYPDSKDVFPSPIAIADGVTIVMKNHLKKSPGFEYVYHANGQETTVLLDNPGEELMPLNPDDFSIVNKAERFVNLNNLHCLNLTILSRSLFGIESEFVESNPDKVRIYTSDDEMDFSHEVKLFTNDKAGKTGHAKWYVTDRKNIPVNEKYIDEWQVVVSSANAGGKKRDNQIAIIDNHSAFGRARVALGSFKTEEEAKNFYNYAQSYIVKFLFLMTDEALTSLGKRVPDLGDYTSSNKFINFSASIDNQLFELMDLDEEEIAQIKDKVDNIRRKS